MSYKNLSWVIINLFVFKPCKDNLTNMKNDRYLVGRLGGL